MNINFPLILFSIVVFTGLVTLAHAFFHQHFGETQKKRHIIIEYCRSFFPVLLVVLIIRSFIISPYDVPTGSLKPTIEPGDLLAVTHYNVGLHMPVWFWHTLRTSTPQRGKIYVFHDPVNPNVNLIKRVVGLPGDRISYIDQVFYINGKKCPLTLVKKAADNDGNPNQSWPVNAYQENLLGTQHLIYLCPKNSTFCPIKPRNFYNLIVPKNHYFMVGDNRDNSDDSRFWGFVPYQNFIGKAQLVWLSLNPNAAHFWQKIRWHRIGRML